jgi:hypothetical protein
LFKRAVEENESDIKRAEEKTKRKKRKKEKRKEKIWSVLRKWMTSCLREPVGLSRE